MTPAMPLDSLLAEHGLAALALGLVFMTAAGFVKGAVGFALPLIALSGLGSVYPPTLAVAALIGPTVVTNVWQTFRQGFGAAWSSLKRFWRLNLMLFVLIGLFAQLVAVLPDRVLFLILGAGVFAFGVLQLLGLRLPKPSKRMELPVEGGVALVGGFFGGLSGIWGPPVVLYLAALEVEKRDAVRAQGISFLIGSIVLVAAHLRSGLLLGQGGTLTLVMLAPALLGMAFGLAVQDRLDPAVFRKVTLAVLVVAGLNLIRRGLTG
ncbi:MAG TPA: sulfite exporter TauE/SafE family protein [Paracoccaceae bacterium]|nr:sulfite exporter TauE/SafE family protein [Paracoccaceae bacterium]